MAAPSLRKAMDDALTVGRTLIEIDAALEGFRYAHVEEHGEGDYIEQPLYHELVKYRRFNEDSLARINERMKHAN